MNPALPLAVAAALFMLLAGFCGWWRGPRARAAAQRNARQISVLREQHGDVVAVDPHGQHQIRPLP